jgi:hypothetical protein
MKNEASPANKGAQTKAIGKGMENLTIMTATVYIPMPSRPPCPKENMPVAPSVKFQAMAKRASIAAIVTRRTIDVFTNKGKTIRTRDRMTRNNIVHRFWLLKIGEFIIMFGSSEDSVKNH